MTVPPSCEYIAVSRQADAEILQIDFATAFPIANRPVVLLKDVVHTGVVETYLITQLAAAGASGNPPRGNRRQGSRAHDRARG